MFTLNIYSFVESINLLAVFAPLDGLISVNKPTINKFSFYWVAKA